MELGVVFTTTSKGTSVSCCNLARCSLVNGLSLLIITTTLSAPLRIKIRIRRSIMATPLSCTKGLGKVTPSCESRDPSPADIIANFISLNLLRL